MDNIELLHYPELSDNMKERIYEEYKELKKKISEISLYDEEKGKELNNKYQLIIQDVEKPGTDPWSHIVELIVEIDTYEKTEGKQKRYNQLIKVVLDEIRNLNKTYKDLNIREFEDKLSYIKERYKKISVDGTYRNREVVERSIYLLQAILIKQKVNNGAIDLYDDISKEDSFNLLIVMQEVVEHMSKNDDKNVQEVLEQIQLRMLDREDAVYDVEIWKLINEAEDIIRSSENKEQNNAEKSMRQQENSKERNETLQLIAIQKKKYKSRLIEKYNERKEQKELEELKKKKTLKEPRDYLDVDLEWLMEVNPDAKDILIDFFENPIDYEKVYFDIRKSYYEEIIRTSYYDVFYDDIARKYNIDPRLIKVVIDSEPYNSKYVAQWLRVVEYAQKIDSIIGVKLGRHFEHDLVTEMLFIQGLPEDFINLGLHAIRDFNGNQILNICPIYRNLKHSLDRLQREFEQTHKFTDLDDEDILIKKKKRNKSIKKMENQKDGIRFKDGLMKPKDLSKIDISWLEKNIEDGLELSTNEIYLMIYDIIPEKDYQIYKIPEVSNFYHRGICNYSDCWNLDLITCIPYELIAKDSHVSDSSTVIGPSIRQKNIHISFKDRFRNVISFAKLIDIITGEDIVQYLYEEIGKFLENYEEKQIDKSGVNEKNLIREHIIKKKMSTLPIYTNLTKSFERISKECEDYIKRRYFKEKYKVASTGAGLLEDNLNKLLNSEIDKDERENSV